MELKTTKNKANSLMSKRCSIRKYDTTVKISREEMTNILQDAMTAPSSFNLQPWRFVVIDTESGKQLIKPYMLFNELQWETSSALIAIFGDLEDKESVDKIYSAAVNFNLTTSERKEKIKETIASYRANFSAEKVKYSAALDCGLVAMQIMLSAKAYGYDTNPIGGFQKEEFAKAVGLDPTRYLPLLLLSVGKAAEPGHNSVRFSVADITDWK